MSHVHASVSSHSSPSSSLPSTMPSTDWTQPVSSLPEMYDTDMATRIFKQDGQSHYPHMARANTHLNMTASITPFLRPLGLSSLGMTLCQYATFAVHLSDSLSLYSICCTDSVLARRLYSHLQVE